MGRLRNLLRKVRDGVKSARDEAAHPGRPPTFKASTNPYVVEPEERIAHERARDAASAPTPAPTAPAKAADDDTPWYLQNPETEGWDATNPGTDPKRKNLT